MLGALNESQFARSQLAAEHIGSIAWRPLDLSMIAVKPARRPSADRRPYIIAPDDQAFGSIEKPTRISSPCLPMDLL
jgi:hypothetical protein